MPNAKPVKKPLSRVEQVRLKQKRAFRLRATLVSVFAVALVLGCVFLMRAPFLQIQKISVLGTKVLIPTDISQRAKQELSGFYLGVIPKTNILFFPKQKLVRAILVAYPRVSTVSVDRQFFTSGSALVLSVLERTQTYLWCSGAPNPIAPCYYLDKDGLVFARAPEISGTVYFKFFGGVLKDSADPINKSIVAPLEYKRYLDFKDVFESVRLFAFGVEIFSPTEIHFLLSRDLSSDRIIVRVRTTDDPRVVASNLATAMTKEPFKRLFEQERERIEYIDLRFPNKVYFRPER